MRYGLVKKKSSILRFFSKNKAENETKTGYVVRVGSDKATRKEYWLFKSKDGKWSEDADGQKELSNDLYMNIKDAISEKELSGI